MPHPHHAFTLIELLAVIAIMVLLASLLLPLLGKGQDYSDKHRNLSLLVQVSQGIAVYEGEFDVAPLQADWNPQSDNRASGFVYHTGTSGGQACTTNNLAWQLAHPHPPRPGTMAEREYARFFTGFPSSILLDTLPTSCLPVDIPGGGFSALSRPAPAPISDLFGTGRALIYCYNPLGNLNLTANPTPPWFSRGRIAVENAEELAACSAFTHAPPDQTTRPLLVSAGPDGLYDARLYDDSIPENADNLWLEDGR